METKGKKKLFNVIMVFLILVIAVSGVFTVGKIKGWFQKAETVICTSGQIKGVANIERKGIGYTLNADTVLQTGDIIETKKSAQAEICLFGQKRYVLQGNTEMIITDCTEEKQVLSVERGELFGDTAAYVGEAEVVFAGHKADLSEAVFWISAQTGSSLMQVYAGDVSIVLSDGLQERVEAGEYISVTEEEDGTITYEIHDIQIASLNENTIAQLQNTESADQLSFTAEELQQVLNDREAEKKAALEASLNVQRIKKEDTEKDNQTEQTEPAAEKSGADEQTDESANEDKVTEEVQTPADNTTVKEEVYDANICTITILCNTILDNMDNLDDGKEAYVPANGTILSTSSVEFEDGETVFDVLKRVCDYAGIQLEYSWTPMYDSYYIEGINHLYEFDCGNESGWMYKVNGWFPNYGCSGYYLEDGDNIVWTYTCNGLGADVGGSNF